MTAGRATGFASARGRVESAALADLLAAYSSTDWRPFALIVEVSGTRFVCPHCRRCEHNGGTAKFADGWRWSCTHPPCRRQGTRYVIEHHVLSDPDMYEALREVMTGA